MVFFYFFVLLSNVIFPLLPFLHTSYTKLNPHHNASVSNIFSIFSICLCQGLEVIEAHYLFGTAYDDIDIVVR